ncbi:MAG: hypothetical protein Q3972_00580 [Corynebacterium sp.]|nr:hypothetical protein [Corynebacterium sp.]
MTEPKAELSAELSPETKAAATQALEATDGVAEASISLAPQADGSVLVEAAILIDASWSNLNPVTEAPEDLLPELAAALRSTLGQFYDSPADIRFTDISNSP